MQTRFPSSNVSEYILLHYGDEFELEILHALFHLFDPLLLDEYLGLLGDVPDIIDDALLSSSDAVFDLNDLVFFPDGQLT